VAEIVGGFGVPHNPHFATWVAQGAALGPEIERMYDGVAEPLHEMAPDVLLYITSDHYNMFFELLPIFMIGVAESAAGASDYPSIPHRELRIDSELARWLQTDLVHAGFDVGCAQELEFDHTVISPMQFLFPERDIPVVPLFINAFMRPLPSSQRCFALGRALRDSLRHDGSDKRVAVVATGSFSLEIGGPRISEDSHTGVPDPGWVERVLELLQAGDVERLVREATDEQLDRAGNAGGELLDWIAMLGTIDPAPPAFVDVQPQFGHAYAAWPAHRT
jgi:hypothetical protein